MASEYILLFLGKHKFKILFLNLCLFFIICGFSYFLIGRTYRASIDFYIINSSFSDSDAENNHAKKIFPTTEEMEIIKSISESNELFKTVVVNQSLQAHFYSNSLNEAIDCLKYNSSIDIDINGKIQVNVKDFDNNKAQLIAKEFIQIIYQTFNNKSKQQSKNNYDDLLNRIDHYNKQKDSILQLDIVSKKNSKDLLEVPVDSLSSYRVLTNLKSKTGLEYNEIIAFVGNVKRVIDIDDKIFVLQDQLSKAEQRLISLSRNNVIILNDTAPTEKYVKIDEHLLNSCKITILVNIFWIFCLMLYRQYQKEINLLLKEKSN